MPAGVVYMLDRLELVCPLAAIDWLSPNLFELMTVRRRLRCSCGAPLRIDQRPPLVARETARMQEVTSARKSHQLWGLLLETMATRTQMMDSGQLPFVPSARRTVPVR
jgi:hypothetical protein